MIGDLLKGLDGKKLIVASFWSKIAKFVVRGSCPTFSVKPDFDINLRTFELDLI